MDNNPQIVVVTPVRNEAWVLEAFLTCTSSWADRILIADQQSNDGSREIAARFPKVTLIDNPEKEMHQARVRQLLFEYVDRIEGDKIVWALDADEFLSEGFEKTEGWQTIINSKPGSIFCFRWQNLDGDFLHENVSTAAHSEWVCHFEAWEKLAELYSKTENRAVHEARVPCTGNATYTDIDDIHFVHLARLNRRRTENKYAFYQVSTLSKLNRRTSAVSLFRTYHQKQQILSLQKEVQLTCKGASRSYNHLVKLADRGSHYINEIATIIRREGCHKFRSLDIWNNPDLLSTGIDYRPPTRYRLLHYYLRTSQRHCHSLAVRLADKVLKLTV